MAVQFHGHPGVQKKNTPIDILLIKNSRGTNNCAHSVLNFFFFLLNERFDLCEIF